MPLTTIVALSLGAAAQPAQPAAQPAPAPAAKAKMMACCEMMAKDGSCPCCKPKDAAADAKTDEHKH